MRYPPGLMEPSKMIEAITGTDQAAALDAIDEYRGRFRAALDLGKAMPYSKTDAAAILDAICDRVRDWRQGDYALFAEMGPAAFTIDDRSGYHVLLDSCTFRPPKPKKTGDE